MAANILVVDDEESILSLVQYHLEKAGYSVTCTSTGPQALETVREHPSFDLILLDLMLPDMAGVDVCRSLREAGNWTPIMILTAVDEEIERVVCLELGADDYVTKPFRPRELVARVKALLRRTAGLPRHETKEQEIRVGNIVIHPLKHEVFVKGHPIALTRKEFQLLHYLAMHPGKVVTRDHLLDQLWGYKYAGDTRVIDVHISHVREKIEDDPKNPRYLKTIRGVGYKLLDREP
jgi:two-component system alkaline phosphatase synthesis response regulator PhoP